MSRGPAVFFKNLTEPLPRTPLLPITVETESGLDSADLPVRRSDLAGESNEVFEVREAMLIALPWSARLEPSRLSVDPCGDLAERLHAAGWRPGMTAEDAARRLAGPQD